ncbi:D-arabinono-1,4-lactone oxidase [Pleionea sp. CnH1-48]|uniref:D-arabinono-1,4-lactone oxidase n=1 Tax=Pleionea sp. CnH1-48 TaxID=2954494 RepID=UPI00209778BA|nr:D-arabinono-1,4-lactone oxidase [Pleionea sp. CnH1-48]MCO7224138.1 FAD-binding protein [Pleionea sp. CnH1-48]
MKLKHLAVSLMSVAMISGGAYGLYHQQQQETLKNYQGTYECHPDKIYDPASIEEVQSIVRTAAAEGRTIMTGNRKFASQIDAACADEGQIQITLKNMNHIVHFDRDAKQVTVEAGLRFNDLNEFLREQKLAVNMVTELGTFTIGGMLGSGTHGSSLIRHNMLADYITEMKIIDGLGNLRVLTGEQLNAARVNLGVLGVVVEVTIQLEDAFKVAAHVYGKRDDSNLENDILTIARNNYSTNIAWFPGIGRYTVTTYHELPLETGGNAFNAQAEVSDLEETLFKWLFDALHEVPGSGLQCLAARVRYSRRDSSYYRDLDTKRIQSNPVGHSDQMQYFGCKDPDSCIWDRLPIALQEVAIPIDELPNWIRDVKQVLEQHPRTCFPLNGIYFRFGKASNSYLGMNAGRDTAYLGIEYTLRQEGNAVPKNYFVNLEIEQMSLRKYGARPHWGKNSVAIFEDMPSRFPKWDQFMAFKQEMDPNNVFTNDFWRRASGETPLSNYMTAGCNMRGECYCENDSHCEEGTQCSAGKYFSDAKICR